MSKAKDPDQAPQPFALRNGVEGFGKWGGIRRRGDPGSIPVGMAYRAENVRLNDDVTERPGVTKIVTTDPAAEAFGLKEYGLDVSRGAILVAHNSVAEVWGYSPDWNATSQDLELDEIVQPTILNGDSPRKSMCVFKDIAYFVGTDGSDTFLYALSLPDKTTTVNVFRKYARVAKFPSGRAPHHMYAGDSNLWIGCQTGHVMRWDGSALYDATATAAALTTAAVMVEFREKTYAIGQQQIKVYGEDDKWTAVTLSVGSMFIPKAAESINDYLYVVGRDGNDVVALRWDGTSWVVQQTLDDGDNIDPWGGVDVCEWNGKAVWAFNRCKDDTSPTGAYVSNLEDIAEIAQFGPENEGRIGSIVVSGGALYACVNEVYSQDPAQTRLLRLDNASAIAGYWTDEMDSDQWTLIKTWSSYGPVPGPEMIDVLPL